jgi:hypothetical protein
MLSYWALAQRAKFAFAEICASRQRQSQSQIQRKRRHIKGNIGKKRKIGEKILKREK